MAEHKLEFFFGGEWTVNPEFDAVWYRSLLSRYVGSWGVRDFSITVKHDHPEGLDFSFVVDASSEEEAVEAKDKILDCLFP